MAAGDRGVNRQMIHDILVTRMQDKRLEAIERMKEAAAQSAYDRAIEVAKINKTETDLQRRKIESEIKENEFQSDFEKQKALRKESSSGRMSLPEKLTERDALDKLKRQNAVREPGLDDDALKTLQRDKEGWNIIPMRKDEKTGKRVYEDDNLNKYKESGMSSDKIMEAYRRKKHLELIDQWVRQAYEGEEVKFEKDGWYIGEGMDKFRIRRNPYAR